MPRPRKWSGPTTAIRVPAALADQLLEIARRLEESSVQNPSAAAVATFSGPYLVTVDQTSYLLPSPPALPKAEAQAVLDLADAMVAELSPEDLALLVARLAEQWGTPVRGEHG